MRNVRYTPFPYSTFDHCPANGNAATRYVQSTPLSLVAIQSPLLKLSGVTNHLPFAIDMTLALVALLPAIVYGVDENCDTLAVVLLGCVATVITSVGTVSVAAVDETLFHPLRANSPGNACRCRHS